MHGEKSIFCRTESIAMTPKSCDHMPTSLWGVAAKWPTQATKTKQTLFPRDPQGYSRISLSLSGRILKEYRNIMSASKQNPMGFSRMGFVKSHSLKRSLHKWVWCSAARKSARLNCINLSTLASLRVDCSGARALLYLGLSAIVTVRGNTVGQHS